MDTETLFPIIPGRLWQSGAPFDLEQFHENEIDTVLNLTPYPDPIEVTAHPVTYLQWDIEDEGLPCLSALEIVALWVTERVRAGNCVLVHCFAGLNRSGLVNALVVREIMGLSGTQAIAHIRICRSPWALCNDTFVHYLESLAKAQDDS